MMLSLFLCRVFESPDFFISVWPFWSRTLCTSGLSMRLSLSSTALLWPCSGRVSLLRSTSVWQVDVCTTGKIPAINRLSFSTEVCHLYKMTCIEKYHSLAHLLLKGLFLPVSPRRPLHLGPLLSQAAGYHLHTPPTAPPSHVLPHPRAHSRCCLVGPQILKPWLSSERRNACIEGGTDGE